MKKGLPAMAIQLVKGPQVGPDHLPTLSKTSPGAQSPPWWPNDPLNLKERKSKAAKQIQNNKGRKK